MSWQITSKNYNFGKAWTFLPSDSRFYYLSLTPPPSLQLLSIYKLGTVYGRENEIRQSVKNYKISFNQEMFLQLASSLTSKA